MDNYLLKSPGSSCSTSRSSRVRRRRCYVQESTSDETSEKLFNEVQLIVIRTGSIVMINDHPCCITEISTSRPVYQGQIQMLISGFDIFSGDRFQDIDEPSAVRLSPIHTVTRMRLLEVREDGICKLSNNDGISYKNIPMPQERHLKELISKLVDQGRHPILTLCECLDQQAIISIHQAY